MKVDFGDAIVLSEMAFGLIPEIFNTIDMIMFMRKKRRRINAIMLKFGGSQNIIRAITVGIKKELKRLFFMGYIDSIFEKS